MQGGRIVADGRGLSSANLLEGRDLKPTLALDALVTRAYRPQTNGKAERFIQSALREWAYGWTYQNSAQRTFALTSWQHHYNWHRPHSGIGGLAPMPRLNSSRNNLLTLHN